MKRQTRADTNTPQNTIFNYCKKFYIQSQAIGTLLSQAENENEYNKILQFKDDLTLTFNETILNYMESMEI